MSNPAALQSADPRSSILNDPQSFAIETIPLDDKLTYDRIFKTANTTAVFQFESRGMKDS